MKTQICAVLGVLAMGTMSGAKAEFACEGNLISGAGVISTTPAQAADFTGCQAVAAQIPPEQLFIDATTGLPVCFKIETSGTAKLSGYSLLTTATMVGVNGTPTSTPACFPLDPARGCGTVGAPQASVPGGSAGLTVFTAQAALTGNLNGKKYGGTLFTQDTGTITASGFSGQLLQVVGGTEDFQGASGIVGVAGQEVGGFANYTGSICVQP